MRIDLANIDREEFDVAEHLVAGEPCFLVQPQRLGVNWTLENSIYRSSLWNAQGEPVSLSWRKHMNWDERPDLDPAPTDLSGCELMEKVDGSTLLISRYRDTMIFRTRGTVDATKMANGDEIALFKERYPKLFDPAWHYPQVSSCPYTLVCEWVSPRNQIVIPYSEPDLYLTGLIWHGTYSYQDQGMLDRLAVGIGIKRPQRYSFDTIPEMLTAVTAFKGVEGICVYYNRGQSWRKCKGAAYLICHRFKENVTESNMLDLFFSYGRPNAVTFLERIGNEFDYECMAQARELVATICSTYTKVTSRYSLMENVIGPLRSLPRRDAALAIQANYVGVWQGAAFSMLSNKVLDDKTIRRLIGYQLKIDA